ncbi:FHA domain-containing protein [Paraburkholderia bryophila]|uniref:FHA domain-containing protein n=1 Tax=Paraburkholderia bryophila TaxID=420952 RepID=UPI00234BB454|nr:FHA domain-containing protein [Paraburkholderia bryophila]WCM20964.1 FHA domain-containing protein [Paraburkholderia bryophila]
MTADAQIVVMDGVHTGASMVLSAGQPLQIGSGGDADLIVIDDGVEPLHATVELQDGTLSLVAQHDGVAVFGRPVAPGRHVRMQRGAWFSVAAVTFRFAGRDTPGPALARNAERAYLLRHEPLGYVAKRWSDAAPVTKATALGVPIAFAMLAWLGSSSPSVEPRLKRHQETFRLVTTHVDTKTGALVYEGYVQSATDLAALTAHAWSRQRAPVMHVFVLAQLQEQVGEFLARYYRGAELSATQPGAFNARLPDVHGFLSPDAWDYARVARLARAEISGLRELAFPGHAQQGERVRVPLDALGLNLLTSRHAAWLTDAQGVRYFVGARLPIGRVSRLSACAAEVTRDDDGSIYEFFVEAAHAPEKCR